MKVRKFLTLLIAAAMITGCNFNKSSNNDASNANNQSSQEAGPSAWSEADAALMASKLSGYVVPFFDSSAVGAGAIEWTAEDYGVYAFGSTIDATVAGNDNVLTKVAALFLADGFEAVAEFDPANGVNYYYLAKAYVDANQGAHVLEANIAALNANNEPANSGNFFLEVADNYYLSWADLKNDKGESFESLVKAKLDSEEDIPDLPAGGLYPKEYFDDYSLADIANENASSVDLIVMCSPDYVTTLVNLFDQAHWTSIQKSASNFFAVSPQETIRVDGTYYSGDGAVLLSFKTPAAVAEKAVLLAGLLNVSKYAITASSVTAFEYEGETQLKADANEKGLEDVFNRYDALLTAGTTDADTYEKKSVLHDTNSKGVEYFNAMYYNDKTNTRIELEVSPSQDNKGAFNVSAEIDDFEGFPEIVEAFCQVIGADPYDLRFDDENFILDVEVETQDTYENLLKGLTDILDNYPTYFEKDAKGIQDHKDNEKQPYISLDYVCGAEGDILARIFVYQKSIDDKNTPEDKTDDVPVLDIEVDFMPYNAAPESAWADAVEAKLELDFTWDNSHKCYFDSFEVDLGESTQTAYATSLIQLLSTPEAGQEEGLAEFLLLDDSYADYGMVEAKMYSEEGYIDIQLFIDDNDTEEDESDDVCMCQVAVYFFKNPELPAYVNAISCAIGVEIDAVEDHPGYYSSALETSEWLSFYVRNAITGLSAASYYFDSYGELSGLVAATGLGFGNKQRGLTQDSLSVIIQYTNADGWTVQVVMYGDGTDWNGTFSVLVVAPAEPEPADPAE